ncbi:MAG: hypothetical protein JO246_04545 [Frankiaceae bacterium]|nr:hypothetical protein [Frankiaceae bacterium]MBV9872495.1 hypothetical protein [Frankiaceae bacterium]
MEPTTTARYADPRATKELPLGPCRCEGTPHSGGDVATVRTEVGWSELKSAWSAGTMTREDGTGYYDEAYGDTMAISRFTVAWNLVDVDAKGRAQARPIDVQTVSLLDEETFAVLKKHTEELLEHRGRLPNGSGGQSVASSPETASPTRRPRR